MSDDISPVEALTRICRGELNSYARDGVTINALEPTGRRVIHIYVDSDSGDDWAALQSEARQQADTKSGRGIVYATPVVGTKEMHFVVAASPVQAMPPGGSNAG